MLNTCENVKIELCTRFLSYKNDFCRTISVCNARSTITMCCVNRILGGGGGIIVYFMCVICIM